jgi:SAM-dependent methyltransferase
VGPGAGPASPPGGAATDRRSRRAASPVRPGATVFPGSRDAGGQRQDAHGGGLHRHRCEEKVAVESGDIPALRFPDDTFDRVVAEAVTMFVDRPRAAEELVRVCRPGGRVLTTELLWRKPPTPEARRVFLGEVCPGLRFDTRDDWVRLYEEAGLRDVRVTSGPFEMMTPAGFLHDEGLTNSLAIMGRALSRPAYLKKMAWLMPRMNRAVPYLGYVAISGVKPA